MDPMFSSHGLFLVMVDEGPLDDVPPFEHVDEDEDEDDVHIYQTMFEHHRDG